MMQFKDSKGLTQKQALKVLKSIKGQNNMTTKKKKGVKS